ncbi:hypothetical protein [Kibdelosporangium aridum]|uniref:hypothetical protein n=1 Tax=Kibdelosporangium aridum TaxID=2030 RepID=UPI0035EEE619
MSPNTTPVKQGRPTPRTHIPVVDPSEFHSNPPDYNVALRVGTTPRRSWRRKRLQ